MSLYLVVTRAGLFREAFSRGISEALIWYFACLSYRASFVGSLRSKPAAAEGLAESSAAFFA